jgi:hypothetical protein
MKTITIRLPDVEAAMLVEVQKSNKFYKELQTQISSIVREQYAKAVR